MIHKIVTLINTITHTSGIVIINMIVLLVTVGTVDTAVLVVVMVIVGPVDDGCVVEDMW